MRAGSPGSLSSLLRELPTRRVRRRLARCVPQLDFTDGDPPRYLFTSRRRQRCNPDGVRCLYFSESEATADAEYRVAWSGQRAEHQPKLTFFAQVSLRKVLDLGDPAVAAAAGVTDDDLFGPWRLKSAPTRLQDLGLAISGQEVVCALRFPSAACRQLGLQGSNFAIFPDALFAPDRVEIHGRGDTPLEVLP